MIRWVYDHLNASIYPVEVDPYGDEWLSDNFEVYDVTYPDLATAGRVAAARAEYEIERWQKFRAYLYRVDETHFPLTNPDFYADIN